MKTIRVLVTLLFASAIPLVLSAIARGGAQPKISAGNVNASCSLTPTSITLNPDGSFSVVIATQLNGAQRFRANAISADGATFKLDGQPISNPPAALQALGAHLSAAAAKINAAYAVPAVQAAVCGP
jgi:hypothetical protein